MTKYLDLEGLKEFKKQADAAYLPIKGTIPLTDKINLTTETKASLALKYAKVSNNTINFYVIADSSNKLPSSETRININSDITDLVGAEGANVGDIFVIGKLNLLPVYKIIPLNDAKAANADFKGTQGVVTPWDKTQINKVPNLESALNSAKNNLPTRTESNMNNALKTGFYPWCTLGRPSGSTGAYTLVTLASTTADNNGYTTIEQTAYGRQSDELGKIFKRIIFKPSSGDVEYGEWKEITTELLTNNKDRDLVVGTHTSERISFLEVNESAIGIINGDSVDRFYGVCASHIYGIKIFTPRQEYSLDLNRFRMLDLLNATNEYSHMIYKKAIRINSNTHRGNRNIYVQKRLMISGFEPNTKYMILLNGMPLNDKEICAGIGTIAHLFSWGTESGDPYFILKLADEFSPKSFRYSMMSPPSTNKEVFFYSVQSVAVDGTVTKVFITTDYGRKKNSEYKEYKDDIIYIGKSPSMSPSVLRDIVLDKINAGENKYRNSAVIVYGLRTRFKKSRMGFYNDINRKHVNWTRHVKKQNIIKVVFYKRGIPIKEYILKYVGDSSTKNRYHQIPKIIG